ncbi:hypothetical protein K492DRAFT_232624 [Lichtheimia hyalospora FSU 10163]|nr:hypothetical protein K492DRAFT_232624 [Lichtheimia hyalospora FSU 10163]
MSSSTLIDQKNKIQHRDRLLQLYGVDLAAAASSSALVAPFISVVDRAIIENANGKRPLGQGLKMGLTRIFTQPMQFAGTPQFRMIFGLYFSTYVTANVMDTTSEHWDIPHGTAAWYKFLATSAINMSLCVLKDRAFARMFGVTASHSLPLMSYLLFAARDSLTIAASFTAPPVVTRWLLEEKQVFSSQKNAAITAQLSCPAAIQFISTPLHLLGLDLYNRSNVSPAQRFSLIRSEYLKSTLARVARIGPAFGIGGVGNTYFRSFRSKVM